MYLNQILAISQNLKGGKQVEAFLQAVVEGLSHHLLPYLYETNLSGLDEADGAVREPKLLFLS